MEFFEIAREYSKHHPRKETELDGLYLVCLAMIQMEKRKRQWIEWIVIKDTAVDEKIRVDFCFTGTSFRTIVRN